MQYVKYRSALKRFPGECGSLGVLALSVRGGEPAPCFFRPHQHPVEIMKKSLNKHSIGNIGKAVKTEINCDTAKHTNTNADSLDDEEQGFGGWLRSSDGLETMKLFVIANSIVMLTTVAYPHVQAVFGIVSDMIYGADALF